MADVVRAYVLLAWTWTRAAWQYRTSLIMLVLTQAAVAALDFVAIRLVFAHTPRLAGFSLAEVMFLYGASSTSFALSDLTFGNTERLRIHLKEGTFDAMLLRPAGALVQLAADEFSPRRLGKLVPSLGALGLAIALLDVSWTPLRVLLVPAMIVSGTIIFAAVWVLGATFQFLATDAAEAVNAFTYGGNFLTQYPMSIYGRDLLRGLVFVVPLAFVNWQPSLYVLSRPDPLGLPVATQFASPLVAVSLALVAGAAWRAGIRRYRSTGS